MRKSSLLIVLLCGLLVLIPLTVSGVYASWTYFSSPAPVNETLEAELSRFVYGDIYITKIEPVEPAVSGVTAELVKTATTTVLGDIDLGRDSTAVASFTVTFYNGSDTVYYYNEAQTQASSNDDILYEISGISQKDAIEPKTYRTITVTFAYDDVVNLTNTTLETEIHFSFVVDKESIGIVVARTAVDRFKDILNNVVSDDSYQTLSDAMSDRSGSSFNAASDVTYIGNVSGSTSDDTTTIETLFGDEFMSMDLDGDGTTEPITMMIKRENLDNNIYTGASYTYTSWNRQYTVQGVEMTLYITSQNLDEVSMGESVVVYAAAFTILEDDTEWTELVPLTKGIAPANNYTSGDWGRTANSFNTSDWVSDEGETLEELVEEILNE